jgi:hypothetical protein
MCIYFSLDSHGLNPTGECFLGASVRGPLMGLKELPNLLYLLYMYVRSQYVGDAVLSITVTLTNTYTM